MCYKKAMPHTYVHKCKLVVHINEPDTTNVQKVELKSSKDIGDHASKKVSEKATEKATEKVTEKLAEKVVEKVAEPVKEPGKSFQQVAEVAGDISDRTFISKILQLCTQLAVPDSSMK
jgi:hypothetical protein